MQMTTREAVQEALECIEYLLANEWVDDLEKKKPKEAGRLIAAYYGLPLSSYFDDKETA